MSEGSSRLPGAVPAAALAVAAIALGLLAVGEVESLRPPPPRSAAAPADVFSAERAVDALRDVLGDGAPHPVGSPAGVAVRERIAARLGELGLAVERRTSLACADRVGVCATVTNLVATLPSPRGGPAILLTAHHDSVAAGAGAADDGAGVACLLEIARALVASPAPSAPPTPIILLVTDGEEAGLLGAEAFAAGLASASPAGDGGIAAVVNLEARGTTGRAMLFETSAGNAGLIAAYARAVERPLAQSLAWEVYRRMPNDTDLSVYRRAGLPGVNLAFFDGVARYHTSRDDLDHLDRGSVQHLGEQALALVRELARAGARGEIATPGRDLVYAEILGRGLLRLPARALLPAAVVAALTLALLVRKLWRDGELGRRELAWGLPGGWLLLLAPVAAGLLLSWGLPRATGWSQPWLAEPRPMRVAVWAAAVAASALVARLLLRRAGLVGVVVGIWSAWSVLAVAIAVVAPGAALGLVAPLVVATFGLWLAWTLAPASGAAPAAVTVVAGLVAGIFWLPVALFAETALGLGLAAVPALALALPLAALAPLWALSARAAALGTALRATAGLVALAATGLACVQAPFSAAAPRRLSLVELEDADRGEAWTVAQTGIEPLPAPLAGAAAWTRRAVLPWSPVEVWAAPAPRAAATPPALDKLADRWQAGERTLRLRLRSPRGATTLVLYVPARAGLRALAVAGQPLDVAALSRRGGAWLRVAILGVPAGGIELEAKLDRITPCEVLLVDRVKDLPPAGAAIAARRPPEAAPSQDGDQTVVLTRVRL